MGTMRNTLMLLVRETGLEPVRRLKHRILSPGCLPIPPLPQHKTVAAKSNTRVPEGQAAGTNIFTCANGLSLTRQAVAGPSFRNRRLSGKASASGEATRTLDVRGASSRRRLPLSTACYAASLWSSLFTRALLRSTMVDTPVFTERLNRVA